MSKATKRKHVYQAVEELLLLPENGQFVARLEASRGNNLHEAVGPDNNQFLVTMPNCFRRNVWIKRGDFVICQWIPEGDKVKAEIVHPLTADNIAHIQEKGLWPAGLECSPSEVASTAGRQRRETDDGDMLPPMDDEEASGDASSPVVCNPNYGSLFGPSQAEPCERMPDNDSTCHEVSEEAGGPNLDYSNNGDTEIGNVVKMLGGVELWDKGRLESWLTEQGIKWTVREHPEAMTIELALEYLSASGITGHFAKNLFLRDKKKGTLYLLCARHQAVTNLNIIGKLLGVGSGRLRFGPAGTLEKHLGVRQGCVTLFALLNDREQNKVTLLMDAELIRDPDRLAWFHPFTNFATTGIRSRDIIKFASLTGHQMKVIEISEDGEDVKFV